MFQSARLKLTAWYLLIIILVSGLFSGVIYTVISHEYNRIGRIQRVRQVEFNNDPIDLAQARRNLTATLVLINLGILGLAGIAGYFLAGRTLRPIKEMVDEQNRFITDASHELRTPITSLKTEIEVNLRDKKLDQEARKILTSNLEEVNNLQVLSDSLIKLTQYQKSNGNILLENVSLAEISLEAGKKVAKLAQNKKIIIKNKIQEIKINADRESLTELLVIFLDNAIKYSPHHSTVTLTSQEIDQGVVLKISDEGIGIGEKDIPHLFDRFYRVDKSRTKTDTLGYGLGLSIAQQIVNKHHGNIEVESKINQGTTFSIYLPF